MTARAIGTHFAARNVEQDPVQVLDFTAETNALPVGVQFLWTNDRGDPTDLDHEWAEDGCIGEGADSIANSAAVCTAMKSLGANNGWCQTTNLGSINILNPDTAEVLGRAFVSLFRPGKVTLIWTQRVPVGWEVQIACLVLFAPLRMSVRLPTGDVSDLSFGPRHMKIMGAYETGETPQNIGYFTSGLASLGDGGLVQGSRSLTWNTEANTILKGYLSDMHVYSDPAPGGGIDGLMAIAALTANGWTIDPESWGFQRHVAVAVGIAGPLPLRGGVVKWQNGVLASGNPYVADGCGSVPLYANHTFGRLVSFNNVSDGADAEGYGVGFTDDRLVSYFAALRMDHASRRVRSRLVRRLCDVQNNAGDRIVADASAFVSGGMRYNLAGDAFACRQLSQFVALPSIGGMS